MIDIPRFAELGVVASMQPLHAPVGGYDSSAWLSRIDPDEYNRAFPWRTLRDAGATLVFGSDWPVVTNDPYKAWAQPSAASLVSPAKITTSRP